DDAASRPAGEDPEKARTYVAPEGVQTEVHLYSDGGFPDVSDFALGNLQLEYHPIGRPGPASVDNVGIVTLTAQRNEKNPRTLEVFGRVYNYRSEPVKLRVLLEVRIDGVLQGLREGLPGRTGVIEPRKVERPENDKEEVRDEPGEGIVTFTLPDVNEQANVVLHARLADVKDSFPLDDEARLVVGVARKARVLVAGPSNEFLTAFFDQDATRKLATTTWLTPAELKDEEKYRKPAREGAWDLCIFDRCAPEKEEYLPFANTFFIDSVPPPWKRSEMPALPSPRIKGWATRHSLM